jgi:K+-sensing histidine kinase KdpD
MDQLWTIVFVFAVAAAFAVAHWHDRDDAKRRAPASLADIDVAIDVYGRRPPSYNGGMKTFERKRAGYVVAVLGVASLTGALKLFGGHVNSTTVALGLLLVVLFVATAWGSRPAVLASLLGVMCFNFFYLPPVGRWTIDAPDNWVALSAFIVTAITAGQLSSRSKRRAEEADAARREVERLYRELQDAFERASQAKALEQSERLKSALLDAVTHDLRTPLTSIKASVTTLLEETRPEVCDGEEAASLDAEGRREMLEVIDEETDRLNRFVEGLVELARIEAGEMRLRLRRGSVEEIVSAALERAAPLTHAHDVRVTIDEGLPAVRVDARAVAEVVYTLLDNAAKYSPEGTRIGVRAEGAGDGTVRLSVEDEGPGVPFELRERVFDKFFRAMRDGDASAPTGAGMGLAIAKGIVEAHGGRVWIEGVAGPSGSRVVVALPIGDDEEVVRGVRELGVGRDERQAAHTGS